MFVVFFRSFVRLERVVVVIVLVRFWRFLMFLHGDQGMTTYHIKRKKNWLLWTLLDPILPPFVDTPFPPFLPCYDKPDDFYQISSPLTHSLSVSSIVSH
jgi:hypothetical protein